MAEPAVDHHPPADSNAANSKERLRTPEELVAKAIAPIKPEFLRPPPSSRVDKKGENDAVAGSDSSRGNGTTGSDANGRKAASSVVAREKKSKRQLKRERREEKKSAAHICPAIAKTGEVGSCGFGDNCRFSHDLDAFLAQRPADLDGECPFMGTEARCPYGVACRFYGTHKEGVAVNGMSAGRRSSEVNGLSKDVQKLLWKNKLKFPKADSVLKSLGLMGPGKPKQRKVDDEEEESNKVAVDDSDIVDENNGGEMASESSNKLEGSVEAPVEDDIKEMVMDDDDLGNQNGSTEMAIESSEKLEGSVEDGVENYTNEVAMVDDLVNENGDCEMPGRSSAVEDDTKELVMADDLRPSKKAKSVVDQASPSDDGNGSNIADDLQDKSCSDSKSELLIGNECSETEGSLKLNLREKKLIDFRGKLYLAPLTTVGNLPFRRLCKTLGADVTCGEMAMCTNLLQGQASEWALLRRHSSEDLFGVQICGAYPDTVAKTVEMIEQECTLDFIDINMGCPIDLVVNKGAGSCLLTKPMRMKGVIQAASSTVPTPITVKVRTAYFEGKNRIDSLIADIGTWGASAITIHGRSRQQRYSKLADWDYIYQCAGKSPESLPVLGNGDIFSYVDWNNHMSDCPKLSSCMLARGALIKPWLFTEIKEQRHWDITSGERLNILKDYVRFGLEHWGSDAKGVETTRHFLLEWLSYSCRYIPVGLLEVIPQRINWRPPSYYGRDELETLMASDSAADWIRITEMLLGKVPESFTFSPKHKSNAYVRAENG